jgi:5-methylcytosine-specific restriction endonuclease McrA
MAEHIVRDQVVNKLAAIPQWSELWARLGERAGWKCEYCDLDFFASIENYKSMQMDHIVPLLPGEHTLDNLAASCSVCNLFKRRFNPREGRENATREELVSVARAHVQAKRQAFTKQLERDRAIIGWRPA